MVGRFSVARALAPCEKFKHSKGIAAYAAVSSSQSAMDIATSDADQTTTTIIDTETRYSRRTLSPSSDSSSPPHFALSAETERLKQSDVDGRSAILLRRLMRLASVEVRPGLHFKNF